MVGQPHVGEGKLRDGAGGYAEGSILENGVRPLGPSSQAQAVVVTNTAVGVRRRPLDPPVPGSPIHGRAEQHDLEWNIASFTVGKGEKKKPILSNIGACPPYPLGLPAPAAWSTGNHRAVAGHAYGPQLLW